MRSGNGGPCNHCGRTSSPCWRKGPPDKPLLCNACGARYLTKRDLTNYLPSGARAEKSAGAAKLPYLQYLEMQPQSSHVQSAQTHRGWQGQQQPGTKRPRQSTPRYELDDLYVKYSREGRTSAASEPRASTLTSATSSASSHSALTKEQSEEKSTLDSSSKRQRLPYGEPLQKIDVNNAAAAGSALAYVQMGGLDSLVTALAVHKKQSRRKQSHPRACAIF